MKIDFTSDLIFLLLSRFIAAFAFSLALPVTQLYAEKHGLSLEHITYMMATNIVVFVVVSLLYGTVLRKWNPYYLISLTFLLCGLSFIFLGVNGSSFDLVVSRSLGGALTAASGVFVAIITFRTVDTAKTVERIGYMHATTTIAWIIGPLSIAVLPEKFYLENGLVLFCVVGILLFLISFLFYFKYSKTYFELNTFENSHSGKAESGLISIGVFAVFSIVAVLNLLYWGRNGSLFTMASDLFNVDMQVIGRVYLVEAICVLGVEVFLLRHIKTYLEGKAALAASALFIVVLTVCTYLFMSEILLYAYVVALAVLLSAWTPVLMGSIARTSLSNALVGKLSIVNMILNSVKLLGPLIVGFSIGNLGLKSSFIVDVTISIIFFAVIVYLTTVVLNKTLHNEVRG